MMKNPLFVFALEGEARRSFEGMNFLFTGVGKVNAAMALTQALCSGAPSCVVNLGTAGSKKFPAGSIVNPVSFIQRDMDVTPLGFAPYQTPFAAEPPVLVYGERVASYTEAVCGTGDNFEVNKTGKEPWDVVDMEAYALALVCQRRKMPFLCLKYISDGADGQAHQDWDAALEAAAQALRRAVEGLK